MSDIATLRAEAVSNADSARGAIDDLVIAINDRLVAIEQAVFAEDRQRTAAEKAEIMELRDDRKALREAQDELEFMLLQQLDDSAEVKALGSKIAGVNADLHGTLDRLKRLAATAETLKTIAEGIAAVIGALVKLAPLLA